MMDLKRLARELDEMSEGLMERGATRDDIAIALERMGFREIGRGVWVPKETVK